VKVDRLFSILLAVIISCGLFGVQGQSGADAAKPGPDLLNVNATAMPDHITLSWTGDPKTTQAITWRTDPTVTKGIVQYSMNQNLEDRNTLSMPSQVTNLKTDLGDQHIHTATLTGLKPGTQYYYRVGDGTNNSSTIFSFKTEDEEADKFQFLVFGDTQSGDDKDPDYSQWNTTIHNAYKANPDASFFMVVGDEAQAGRSNLHWNYWFDACKGVIDSISYMPVVGNTDCRDLNRTHGEPTIYLGQFKTPANGPFKNSQAYSFDYGNVHFVILDSQLREQRKINPNLLKEQQAWLEKDLSLTDKEWKVAIWHKPPYFSKAFRSNNATKNAFTPIIDKHHVDLVFNGHDHAYSRSYPINDNQIVSSPDLGTVYVIAGRSGAKYLKDNERKAWTTDFFDPQDMPNYIVVDVDESSIEIKTYKMDGTLIDDYTIEKNEGDTPRTAVPSRYNRPWLAVNGILLNRPLITTPPSQINETWYLPIKPIAKFLGGSESVSGSNETLSLSIENYEENETWSDEEIHTVVITNGSARATLDNVPISIPDSVVVDSDGNFLISADDVHSLFGFSWWYDSDRNILFLNNPSKIGE